MSTRQSVLVIVLTAVLAVSCVAGTPEQAVPSAPAPASTEVSASAVKSPRPIGYADLSALLTAPDSKALLLDVRTKEEFDAGHIAGSVLMPYDAIKATFAETDKNRPIVVYCRSGRRSEIAAETLTAMGFTDVSDFGGIDNWKGKLAR